VAVCQAVAYAHSRGVLHRDLKPANVMVGKYGETLVVDWGLAKLLGRADGEDAEGALRPSLGGDPTATQPGVMSPEQAAGRLDRLGPGSDVYSLGATLYSVLTGRPPLTDPDTGEVLRRVQRGDFPRPREASPDVPAALEAVCLKAMALRPEDRYGSPQELAADVERWLADEPVGAYREPLPARLARWARRHRASVTSAAAALAVLALSLGVLAAVLTAHNRALAAANGRERAALDREREAKDKARGNFRLAREAVKDYCVKVSLDPRLRQADFSGLRKELLETAARFHERFKEQEGDDDEVRAERAYAYFELAFIAKLTGSAEEALGHYRQSLALWGPLVEAHPDSRAYRWGLASCYNDMATDLAAVGRAGETESAYRKSLALRQELADADPGDQDIRGQIATVHSNLAFWLVSRNRFKEAEDHYGKALATHQALLEASPGKTENLRNVADTRHKLGYLYVQMNRPAEAGEAYRQALTVRRRLSQDHPSNAQYRNELGYSYLNIGQWYRGAGEPRKAAGALKEAVNLFQQVSDAHPSVPDYLSHLSAALQNLGLLHQAEGQTQQAGEAHRRALDIQERLTKLYPANVRYAADVAGNYCNTGRRLTQNGDPQAALEWFDKAQAKLEEVRRRDRNNMIAGSFLCNTHWNRARALLQLDRPAEALREWDRALELARSDKDRADLRMSRAYTLARLGKYDQALPVVEELVGRPEADRYALQVAAQVYSLASAGQGAGRESAGGKALSEKYASRAVALLRRAQDRGLFKTPASVTFVQKERDFDALRQRPDFRKLLGELGTKPRGKAGAPPAQP
jgi:serine/threonine-protein kinase